MAMKNVSSTTIGVRQVTLAYNLKFWLATVILVLIYSTVIFAQYTNTIYIDPENSGDPEQDGTIDHPFDNISEAAIQDNTAYLIKRGSTMISTSGVTITMKENVKVGVYGEGNERPTYQYNGSGSPVFNVYRECSNIIIDSLIISGQIGNGVDALIQYGGYVSGTIPTTNVTISNCELRNAYNGIRSPFFSTGVGSNNVTIINCEIHNIEEDGFFIAECDDLTIENCHIYDVNMDWHLDCHTEACAPGDGIQIGNNVNNFLIKNNIIDRRGTGNKFCFIFGGLNTEHIVGNIIGNTFYPPIDTTDNNGGNAIYLSTGNGGSYNGTETITIAYNKFVGRGYSSPNVATHAIFSVADTVYCYGNLFDSIGGGSVFNQQSNHVEFYNNTLVSPLDVGYMILLSGVPSGFVRNNLAAANTSENPIWVMNSNVTQSNNTQLISSETSLYNDALDIVDWETGDYHRSLDADDGVDVGLECDIEGVYISDPPESGAFEYSDGGQSNNPPVINDQSYSPDENTSEGEVIGEVEASDPDAGQELSFSILSGNVNNAFQIGAQTGVITVSNSEEVNFEANPDFDLIIEVQDNGPGTLTDQAEISILLNDINEAPGINDQNFVIESSINADETVGVVVASDPDQDQILLFSISSGNEDDAFEIVQQTGELILLDPSVLDFSQNPVYSMVIQVMDNGDTQLTAEGIVSLSTVELNQVPVIADQAFEIAENSANGTQIGTIDAIDPDEDQILTFSITSGNYENAFQIDALTGVLSVSNSSSLNFESISSHSLTIKVEDDGFGNLSSEATVTVNVIDLNESPEIQDQTFTIDENSPSGTEIGVVNANDPDQGQTMSFTIISGNTENAFAINGVTGVLSVSNELIFDFEATPELNLVIEVMDNGDGNLSVQGTVTVILGDVNESPVVADQDFAVDENCPDETVVGTVLASDPDAGQSFTYSIVSGNINDAFSINDATGILSVSNGLMINFEEHSEFDLVVKVEDNGSGNSFGQGDIIVYLNDINESPELSDQYFSIDEYSVEETVVGTVEAYDPDNGQVLEFSLESGNTMDAFQINPTTGVISVLDSSALILEINPVFLLTVKVQDNGQGKLSTEATVVITLIGATSISEGISEPQFNFKVFPNPAADYLNLHFNYVNSNELAIKIYNYLGEIVYRNVFVNSSNQIEDKLSVSHWANGYYIIYIEAGDRQLQTKMIKI